MNKRQAKKKFRKALELMETGRKTGVGGTIINQTIVDKNGKPCSPQQKDARFITLKYPKYSIQN